MNVNDLRSLATKVVAHADEVQLIRKYHAFVTTVENVHRNHTAGGVIAGARNELFDALQSFEAMGLNYAETKLFQGLRMDRMIGPRALADLNALIFDREFDPNWVIDNLRVRGEKLFRFLDRQRLMADTLSPLAEADPPEAASELPVLEFCFRDAAKFADLASIRQWLARLESVFAAFAPDGASSPALHRLHKSNVLVLGIAVPPDTLQAIAVAVRMVVANVAHYAKILAQIDGVRALGLSNRAVEAALVEEARTFAEAKTRSIAEQLSATEAGRLAIDHADQLDAAVRILFDFVLAGGRIDCTHPHLEPDLRARFADIRTTQLHLDRSQQRATRPPS